MTNLLKCNVLNTGTQFTVNSDLKDSMFMPGTQGFISYIMGPDHNNPNIVFQQAVITRRGKGGKERLNTNTILSPIFCVPEIKQDVMFPGYSERKYFVDFEYSADNTIDMLRANNTADTNFFGWMLSRSLFAKEVDSIKNFAQSPIAKRVGIRHEEAKINIWPKDTEDILRKFVTGIESLYNSGETERLVVTYGLDEIKLSLVRKIKAIESNLVVPMLDYRRKVNGVLICALDYIETLSKNKTNLVDDSVDVDALFRRLSDTRKYIELRTSEIEKSIEARLKIILKNRKPLNF